ncbi:uroporphyrinogen-III synthase [Chloroflexota bacterium]
MANQLAGRRIVNTRAPHQAPDLDHLLETKGAQAIAYPCIDIVTPDPAPHLDEALRAAADGQYDWLILTSRNVAYAIVLRLAVLGLASNALAGIKTAVVGPSTAQLATELLGVVVTLMPEEHIAESLAAELELYTRARLFLPQSNLARPVLARRLSAAGLTVTTVTAYQTILGSGGDDVPTLLARQKVDAITFTSSSTVINFIQRLTAADITLDVLLGVCVACIGPVTAQTAREQGLTVQVVPVEYTLAGLVQALTDYFAETKRC